MCQKKHLQHVNTDTTAVTSLQKKEVPHWDHSDIYNNRMRIKQNSCTSYQLMEAITIRLLNFILIILISLLLCWWSWKEGFLIQAVKWCHHFLNSCLSNIYTPMNSLKFQEDLHGLIDKMTKSLLLQWNVCNIFPLRLTKLCEAEVIMVCRCALL